MSSLESPWFCLLLRSCICNWSLFVKKICFQPRSFASPLIAGVMVSHRLSTIFSQSCSELHIFWNVREVCESLAISSRSRKVIMFKRSDLGSRSRKSKLPRHKLRMWFRVFPPNTMATWACREASSRKSWWDSLYCPGLASRNSLRREIFHHRKITSSCVMTTW